MFTSLSLLILVLGSIIWLFLLFICAKQIIQPHRVTRIAGHSIPLGTWIIGLIISGTIIILSIAGNTFLIEIYRMVLIKYFLVFLLGLLILYSMIIIAAQIPPSQVQINIIDRIKRSLISGFCASIAFGLFIAILGLMQDNYSLDSLGGIVCIILPVQLIATVGTFIRLGWQYRFYKFINGFVENHISKDNKPNQ